MSNFADSHGLRTFKERRKAMVGKDNSGIYEKWLTADRVVDEVYCDMVNGATKSEVVLKLANQSYENQKNPIAYRTAIDYVKAAEQRMAYDFEKDAEKLRADMCARLTAVYQECMQKGDRYNAIQSIQTMMRLTGLDRPQQTNIQINNNKEGIVVNFGFKEEETNED